jgi:uncharacterized protein YajQ (UPF0234 family)
MPSFDITSKVDLQTLDNAINVVKKEVENRYDFKGSHVQVDLNKKDLTVALETDSDMQMRQLEDILLTKSMRQGIDSSAFDMSAEPSASGKHIRKTVKVKNGIDRDTAKKIVKLIKDSKLKVEPSIMDDIIRVTAKKIDDLQSVIQLCRTSSLDLPLQYVNMKS